MNSVQRPLSEHRLARLAAWLMALLVWFASGAPARTRAHKRHHQRYGDVAIGKLRRAVRDIVLIRAAQLVSPRPQSLQRDFAPPGFRHRRKRFTLRAVAGVWLRRYLRARGGFIAQVKHLLEALRHYRGLGAALAWRRRFGLTRLCRLIAIRPPAGAARSLFAPPTPLADSS